MKTLKFHLVIVILCCVSFLLLAGSVTFRKEFNVFKKELEIKNSSAARLINAEKLKNTASRQDEGRLLKPVE
ncbi:MAG: hypothetical protein JNM14_01245 [Ferruginibacter sp.]|nr:hypothetical protein [Ferruginibacter sp.]